MNPPLEIEKWIHELLDGTIADETLTKLQAVMLQDPKARQLYYDLLCTDQMLADLHGVSEPAEETPVSAPPASITPEATPRRRWFRMAAAAILLFGAVGFIWKISHPFAAALAPSAGAYFTINGSESTAVRLTPDQRLDVAGGQVTVSINRSSEIQLEGPAGITLVDSRATVALRYGRAGFTTLSDSPGLEILAAGAKIQPETSHFNIRMNGGLACQISVASGKVRVDRQDGTPVVTLLANDTLECSQPSSGGGPSSPTTSSGTLVFDDDFSEPEGTPLNGKAADVGGPWQVVDELLPTTVGHNRLDTSNGFKILRANFAPHATRNSRPITDLTFLTTPPLRIWDKRTRLEGVEKITLKAADGTPLCTALATAADEHRWKIRNEITGKETAATEVYVFGKRSMKLRCDPTAGLITLYAEGYPIAELPFQSDKVPASIAVENQEGGDVALTHISVRVIEP